jgi:hypothetical protein
MGKAIIIVKSAIFDPITLPKDSIALLFTADVIPNINSGKEVAAAIIKTLIVYSDILNALAKEDEEDISHSTDLTSKIQENIINTK